MRTSDMACRWGGGEFILLFSDLSMHKAKIVLSRLQDTINEYSFVDSANAFSVTVTIGLTEI